MRGSGGLTWAYLLAKVVFHDVSNKVWFSWWVSYKGVVQQKLTGLMLGVPGETVPHFESGVAMCNLDRSLWVDAMNLVGCIRETLLCVRHGRMSARWVQGSCNVSEPELPFCSFLGKINNVMVNIHGIVIATSTVRAGGRGPFSMSNGHCILQMV